MGIIGRQMAIEPDAQFEAAIAESFQVILPNTSDFDLCTRYLRHFETGLRAGDALPLAIAGCAISSLSTGTAQGRQIARPAVGTGIRPAGGGSCWRLSADGAIFACRLC
jgi:hypothetical protein